MRPPSSIRDSMTLHPTLQYFHGNSSHISVSARHPVDLRDQISAITRELVELSDRLT